MQTIIEPTKDISPELLEQIKRYSPWDGLKSSLGEAEPRDVRVHFAQYNISGYVVDEEKLVTYAAFGRDSVFNINLASSMGISPEHTAVMMYLFTVPAYQNQGHAKELIDALALYAKRRFPQIRYLIRTTSSDENKELYLKYGAKLYSAHQENRFLQTLKIHNDYFFAYEL